MYNLQAISMADGLWVQDEKPFPFFVFALTQNAFGWVIGSDWIQVENEDIFSDFEEMSFAKYDCGAGKGGGIQQGGGGGGQQGDGGGGLPGGGPCWFFWQLFFFSFLLRFFPWFSEDSLVASFDICTACGPNFSIISNFYF